MAPTSEASPVTPKVIGDLQRKHPKLISQTAINFAANGFSAAFGLLNVIIFTRLLSTGEYGVYALGLGFAAIVSTVVASWVRLYIIRTEPRGEATDVRSIALPGLLLSCLIAPLGYIAGLLSGLQSGAAIAAVVFGLAFSRMSYSKGPIFAVPDGTMRFCSCTAVRTSCGASPFDCIKP